MAAVYKAKHMKLDALRAIKIIREEWTSQQNFIARFNREARLLVKLQHPNLVQIHDFFEEQRHLFLVMEYVSGGTLAQRLKKRKRLPEGEILPIIMQALSGLEEAHRHEIVHRDISPGNLMLSEDNNGDVRVVIIDFGIATASGGLTSGNKLTVAGRFLGKPEYCSPEQAMGLAIDHRSDLYSMGLVLFRGLTGVTPFKAKTPRETLALRRSADAPRLSEAAPDLMFSEEIESVLGKVLERDPAHRYSSALDFRLALKHILPKDIKSTDVYPTVTIKSETDSDENPDLDTGSRQPDTDTFTYSVPNLRNVFIGVFLALIMIVFGVYLAVKYLVNPEPERIHAPIEPTSFVTETPTPAATAMTDQFLTEVSTDD